MNRSVCIHVLFIAILISKLLKPSMTEQVFFFLFFFSMVIVLDLNKIMKLKLIKIRAILYIKEENFDCKYVSWKKY